MKHIKDFNTFVNESKTKPPKLESPKTIIDKYKDNPYGLGADVIDTTTSSMYAVLRFDDAYSRNEVKNKLKEMGVHAKKMTNSIQPKGYKFRYELNVFY